MSNKIILVEHLNPSESEIILERNNLPDGSQGLDRFLKGVFAQAEIRNRNKRVYPLSEMVTAVSALNEQIKCAGGVFGELDHPENRLTIAMDRVSHVITEMYMDGNNVIGKAKILNTPMGLILKELCENGVAKPAVSTRGAGNVNGDGTVSGFQMITVDAVATPSAMGAHPNLVSESLAGTQGQKVITLAEALQSDPKAQIFFRKEMDKFLRSLV